MDFYTPPPNKKIIKWNGSSQDNQQMSPTRRHHKYLINLCWTLLVTCFSRTVVSLWSVLMEISLKSIVTTILRKIAETLKSLHFLPSTVPQICINAPTKHFLNDFPLASFFFFCLPIFHKRTRAILPLLILLLVAANRVLALFLRGNWKLQVWEGTLAYVSLAQHTTSALMAAWKIHLSR